METKFQGISSKQQMWGEKRVKGRLLLSMSVQTYEKLVKYEKNTHIIRGGSLSFDQMITLQNTTFILKPTNPFISTLPSVRIHKYICVINYTQTQLVDRWKFETPEQVTIIWSLKKHMFTATTCLVYCQGQLKDSLLVFGYYSSFKVIMVEYECSIHK